MSAQILLIALAVAVVLIVIFRRFSGGRQGTLRPSEKATADYESFLVNPDLRYYLSGSDVFPDALIGIIKAWSLDSDLWKQRDLEPKGMQEVVASMQAKASQRFSGLQGFDILDDKGIWIGNWYSALGQNVVIRITGEHRVVISTPSGDANPEP